MKRNGVFISRCKSTAAEVWAVDLFVQQVRSTRVAVAKSAITASGSGVRLIFIERLLLGRTSIFARPTLRTGRFAAESWVRHPRNTRGKARSICPQLYPKAHN